MLARFDPALVQLKGLTDQLAGDSEALAGLIRTAATTTTAIASRDPELRDAVSNTAVTLRAIATQNHALADGLTRAPAVLRQAGTTLADATDAVNALRPALRDVGPAAGPLIGLLGRVDRVLPRTLPVVAELRGDLPQLREAFAGLPRLRPPAVNAFESAATALRVSRPIVHAVRLYGADLLIGVFQGLFSVGGAGYDANGHYVKLNYTQPYQNTFGGVFAGLLADPLAPDLFNLRQRLLRRCPGGNTAPAPDGSSPWVLDSSLCTAAHDTPATVNEPPKSIVGAP
jgi:hypothetical protein